LKFEAMAAKLSRATSSGALAAYQAAEIGE
jgi:hypothetical protein